MGSQALTARLVDATKDDAGNASLSEAASGGSAGANARLFRESCGQIHWSRLALAG